MVTPSCFPHLEPRKTTSSHPLWVFFPSFASAIGVLLLAGADATPQTWEVKREKLSKTHAHTWIKEMGGGSSTVAGERKARMEMSRHDYSNTVIKEEMLFFKLSG